MIKKNIFVICILSAVLLTACGSNKESKRSEEAPILLEPQSNVITYEEVIRRDVGNSTREDDLRRVSGVVVPGNYCQFFLKPVSIDEIKVAVGDYVHVSDEIASVDTKSVQSEIDELKAEVNYREGLSRLLLEKYNTDLIANGDEYDLSLKSMWENSEEFTAKEREAVNGALSEFKENAMMEILLNDFNISYLNEEIASQSRLLADTKIYADHEGVITYIKDLNLGNSVASDENIAVITDYNDLHYELEGITVKDKIFEKYDDCYCIIDDKKYSVKESEYSPMELQIMQSRDCYANVKIIIEDYDGDLNPADTFEVVFRNNYVPDILSVRNECLYKDVEGSFVYVKTALGEEKRRVTIGGNDKKYTQIISGLSQNEEVRREINPLEKEDEDFKSKLAEQPIRNWIKKDFYEKKFCSKKEGIVSEVLVEKSSNVQKGDTILTIRTNGARSEAVGINSSIKALDAKLLSDNKSIDEEKDDLNRRLTKEVLNPLTEVCEAIGEMKKADIPTEDIYRTQLDLQKAESMYRAKLESLEFERNIALYEYNYEKGVLEKKLAKANEDLTADGKISINAKEDGVIGKVTVKPGKTIKTGDELYVSNISCDDRVYIYSDDELGLGKNVIFKKDEDVINATVSGVVSRKSDKFYVSTKDGRVYLTRDSNHSSNNAYYVTFESDEMKDRVSSSYACSINKLMLTKGQ